MSSPVIPLHTAEMLFVAMGVVIQEIELNTDYPTENLNLVMEAYVKSRDKYVLADGHTHEDIKNEQGAALDAVTQWLDDRQLKDADVDFALWVTEIEEEDVE